MYLRWSDWVKSAFETLENTFSCHSITELLPLQQKGELVNFAGVCFVCLFVCYLLYHGM